jgi:hypothetical protein
MPPANLKLFQAELDNIIRQTEEAILQMNTVNGQVNYLAPSVQQNNQSDSGRIILRRLNDWTDDYPKIVNNMAQINQQVHAMRNALAAGADFATSAAAAA